MNSVSEPADNAVGAHRLKVYVAVTSFDLKAQRQAIVRQIEDWGYAVLPARPLHINAASLRSTVEAALASCCLSIHLISSERGLFLEAEDKSLVGLQYEIAQLRLVDRIVWIRPGSQPHENVLTSIDQGSQAGVERLENRSIEYLKDIIEAKLKRLAGGAPLAQQPRPIVRVFVSHSSKDRAIVKREIISPLREHGIEPWYSEDNIETASDWERGIADGLKGCDWFVVVLTPRSVASKWVRREVFWAMEKRERKIIPILREACEPEDLHIGLLPIQHIDFREDLHGAQAKFLAKLGRS